ncbi:MAG TPA: hypothetical protein VK171_06835, partial [Fimbriimonas sp.]|nr:hypothetical protein [Fimbriimonas sp.]
CRGFRKAKPNENLEGLGKAINLKESEERSDPRRDSLALAKRSTANAKPCEPCPQLYNVFQAATLQPS